MYQNYPNYYAAAPMQPQTGIKGRPVSSIDEARAANIDFDGSLFVFPDTANKKIYTKQINLDGTASMKVYTLVEDTPPAPAFVTRQELNSVIEELKLSLGGKNNGTESNPAKSNNNATFAF